MFFRRKKKSTALGIRLGRYANGLGAVWAWEQRAHLLVVEREDYGAGENLVRSIAREHDGERIQLDPKEYRFRDHQPWMFMTYEECVKQLILLGYAALERAERIENGEDVAPMLVTIPELHDILEGANWPAAYDGSEAGKRLLHGLQQLLKVGRAGRIHVMANIRQGYFYKKYLPQELLGQFSAHLVLGKTSRLVTERLSLPRSFQEPHGLLGDLDGGFWPLGVRRR